MTITRSLLSKLHLPYKQLGIEGSRGDQLYLPDDVGVYLSLSHGISSNGMEPIKADSHGARYTNRNFPGPNLSIDDLIPICDGRLTHDGDTIFTLNDEDVDYILIMPYFKNPDVANPNVVLKLNATRSNGDVIELVQYNTFEFDNVAQYTIINNDNGFTNFVGTRIQSAITGATHIDLTVLAYFNKR